MEGIPMRKIMNGKNLVLYAIDAGLYFYLPNDDDMIALIPPIIQHQIDILKQVSIIHFLYIEYF